MKAVKLPSVGPAETLGQAAAKILSVRLRETWSRVRPVMKRGRAEALHRFRIAIKRLRYSMEIYAPLLGAEFHDVLAEIKNAQDILGQLHDRDMALERLADYRAKVIAVPARARNSSGYPKGRVLEERALAKLATDYQRERDLLYRRFLSNWRRMGRSRIRARLLHALTVQAQPAPSRGRRPATSR
ncbi:MAG: CHAD domain-containing protein [Acidobacteria bacterium]|nr:CHAD domain-containing protein [Acidobacteriota bacterium]